MDNFKFDAKDYKKRTNKNHISIFFIVFLIILLTIGSVFLLPKQNNVDRFYFVEIDSFSRYSDATILAQKIQQESGAGYVHYDEKYHVLVSFYVNKKQAKSVVENISADYPNSDIYTLEIFRFLTTDNLTKKQNKIISDVSQFLLNTIHTLSEFSIEYDSHSRSMDNIKLNIKNQLSSFISLQKNFNTLFHTDSKFNSHKSYLTEIINSLNRIIESFESQFSRIIKFETINIIMNYSSFSTF